jgi:asparagine synthase (glutamine-hydrolysing)
MCGIWALIKASSSTQRVSQEELKRAFESIAHRGPDHHTMTEIDERVKFGFHRLSIIDPSEHSHQPLSFNGCQLICNGEIYNYHQLDHDYPLKTRSDCEVILHLYQEKGLEETIKSLDAEFAFVLYDQSRGLVHLARDPFGVRPLFWGWDENGDLYSASEAKALDFLERVSPFPPAHFYTHSLVSGERGRPVRYHQLPPFRSLIKPTGEIKETINSLLTEAVSKRLMSDRPLGCLLSGGLDSSLITSLATQLIPNARETLHCFSIGMRDSVDVRAAKKVVEFLGIRHHHIVEFEPEDGLRALEDVVRQLETYDVTTIRASIPQYLLAKYVREQTDIKVLLSGEGADELFGGYQYFKKTNDERALYDESKRLLEELYLFDNLRTDRTTAVWGLEVRVPFLDLALTRFVTGIDPVHRLCHFQMEKMVLRESFNTSYLPPEILYRCKEAFSDAVSSKKRSWYQSLVGLIEQEISEEDLENAQKEYSENPPPTREALYYRRVFERFYPGKSNLTPHYWMPRWVNLQRWDPSATVLDCHQGDLDC